MDRADKTYQHAIEALLHRHIGLNPQSIGTGTIAKVVAQTMKKQGFTTLDAYWQHVQTSETGLAELVNAIVIPETSFFRHPESFACLQRFILSEWASQAPQRPLRILSIPCSTGEEPYSIVITLLEAGLTPRDFQVDAVDISTEAIARAQKGRYTTYSFRKAGGYSPERHMRQYFLCRQGIYHLRNRVRSQVQFHYGNLVDMSSLNTHSPYDIIFCRNLLIYLHQAARDRAVRNLYRILNPQGLLFVGYAETNQLDLCRFTPLQVPQAFAYQKVLSQQGTTPSSVILPQSPVVLSPQPSVASSRSPVISPSPPPPSPSPLTPSVPLHGQPERLPQLSLERGNRVNAEETVVPHSPVEEDPLTQTSSAIATALADIRSLADRGELGMALEHCDHYLQSNPTSAAIHLLVGEIHQAQGSDEKAEKAFQKALYLDPVCEEALMHLLLQYEQKGEQTNAQRLRQRLERLSDRG